MHREALLRAIKIIGSQTELAKELNVDVVRINNWLNRDKKIPFEYCVAIEMLTQGAVKKEELAPHVKLPRIPDYRLMDFNRSNEISYLHYIAEKLHDMNRSQQLHMLSLNHYLIQIEKKLLAIENQQLPKKD